MDTTKPKRTLYLDVLRVTSMFGVILLHVLAGPLRNNIGSTSWIIYDVLAAFATVSVPIFFMISGALILNSTNTKNLKYVWKNRILKILIPFLIWSIIAIITYAIHDHRFSWKLLLGSIALLPGRYAAPALWFVYPLLVIYIISPVLKYMIDAIPRKLLTYLLIIWIITSVIFSTLANTLPEPYSRIFTLRPDWQFVSGYLGYFILGYYLATMKKQFKTSILSLISIATILISSTLTYFFSIQLQQYDERINTYVSLFVLIISTMVFLIAKNRDTNFSDFTTKFTEFHAPLSYGVYLVHNLFVLTITTPLFINLDLSLEQFLPLDFVVISALSVFTILILSKIPVINYLFTGTKKTKFN